MSGQAGLERCHWCGRPLDGPVCPHCDRRSETWFVRTVSRLHLHDDFWLPALAVIAVLVAIGVLGFGLVRARSEVGSPTSGARSGVVGGSTPDTPDSRPVQAGSTFSVLGPDRDESGHRARLGYAFVVHTGPTSSDLLTDYGLVAGAYARGARTVDLGNADTSLRATIVAVSPDPHVALLRIAGRFPALPIAAVAPRAGDTVVLGEDGDIPAPRATVVAHTLPGLPSHLTFNVGVDNRDDGTPVLDLAGRVVGIAEPSAPFGTDRLGYAVPIATGCLAVRAC